MRRRFNGLHNISRTSEYIQRKAFSNSSSINNADDDSICPVLIVGAGPVGLSLSLLLTKLGSYLLPKTFFIQLLGIQIIYLLFDLVPKKNKYIFWYNKIRYEIASVWAFPLWSFLGVKCAVLEKSTTFSKHPQAHFINNRSMEVCSLTLNHE